jgi:hypothetical protein
MAALYPGRILLEEPPERPPPMGEGVRTSRIAGNVHYARLYRPPELSEALGSVSDDATLVLDLRYVASASTDATALAGFAAALGEDLANLLEWTGAYPMPAPKRPETAEPFAGRAPLFVLVNGKTAGPLEAVLDGLQRRNRVLLIGAPTAGRTGAFAPFEGNGLEVLRLVGEIRAAGGSSLIPDGVEPAIAVRADAEDELSAYLSHENGTALDELYSATLFGGDADEGGNGQPRDATLQRALQVVAALEVLQGLPASARQR